MAIPQERLSTVKVLTPFLPPEGPAKHPTTTFERGPIAVEDTSQGLQYQNWMLTWDRVTDMLTLTPETTGDPEPLFTVADVRFTSFTFDQAGRVSLTYVTGTSSYLYWFDTALGDTVTTNLGADVITPVIHLDDKRETQLNVNDMLLWFTRSTGSGSYNLIMALQRERFLTEYVMETGLVHSRILALGMTTGSRIRIQLTG